MSDHGKEGESARVLRYRPRTSATAPSRFPESPHVDREIVDDAPDDFRHRMIVNAAGLAFVALLTASGIWLASRMSDLRNTQDCVLTGRRNCAPMPAIERPSQPMRQH